MKLSLKRKIKDPDKASPESQTQESPEQESPEQESPKWKSLKWKSLKQKSHTEHPERDSSKTKHKKASKKGPAFTAKQLQEINDMVNRDGYYNPQVADTDNAETPITPTQLALICVITLLLIIIIALVFLYYS